VVALVDPQLMRFSILEDDYPLTMQESMALVDRGQNGFGTLDSVAVSVDGRRWKRPRQRWRARSASTSRSCTSRSGARCSASRTIARAFPRES